MCGARMRGDFVNVAGIRVRRIRPRQVLSHSHMCISAHALSRLIRLPVLGLILSVSHPCRLRDTYIVAVVFAFYNKYHGEFPLGHAIQCILIFYNIILCGLCWVKAFNGWPVPIWYTHIVSSPKKGVMGAFHSSQQGPYRAQRTRIHVYHEQMKNALVFENLFYHYK